MISTDYCINFPITNSRFSFNNFWSFINRNSILNDTFSIVFSAPFMILFVLCLSLRYNLPPQLLCMIDILIYRFMRYLIFYFKLFHYTWNLLRWPIKFNFLSNKFFYFFCKLNKLCFIFMSKKCYLFSIFWIIFSIFTISINFSTYCGLWYF